MELDSILRFFLKKCDTFTFHTGFELLSAALRRQNFYAKKNLLDLHIEESHTPYKNILIMSTNLSSSSLLMFFLRKSFDILTSYSPGFSSSFLTASSSSTTTASLSTASSSAVDLLANEAALAWPLMAKATAKRKRSLHLRLILRILLGFFNQITLGITTLFGGRKGLMREIGGRGSANYGEGRKVR